MPPGAFSTWLSAHLHVLSLWIAALCTLGLYSVLYKENKLYRFFEHLFLGLATGFLISNTWTDVLRPRWYIPMHDHGQWWYIFLMAVGLFYYFIYTRQFSWLARLMIGFYLGIASGQAFQVFANDVWPQVPASFRPMVPGMRVAGHALSYGQALNNLVFTLVLVCVLSYFFFAFEQRSPVVKGSARLGRWMMMFSFGAIFGLTMMARLALLIDRMYFLLEEFPNAWGAPLDQPSYLMLGVILLLIFVVLYLVKTGRGEDTGPPEEPT